MPRIVQQRQRAVRSVKKRRVVATRAKAGAGARAADDLLIEIGCEELPASYLPEARERATSLVGEYLQEQRLACGAVTVWAAPRRLVVSVRQLAARQQELVEKAMGPSKAVAFDAQGQPTKAAVGFAARHGVPVTSLAVETTPKGEYVAVTKRVSGQPTERLIQPLLDRLVRQIGFPKTMRWDESGATFARPVRWLLVLYGGRVVSCAIGRVRSAGYTVGHRQRKSPRIAVRRAGDYLAALRKQGILVDHEERRKTLLRMLEVVARRAGGRVDQDDPHVHALLEELLYLSEMPQVIAGRFEGRFAERLPEEVLLAAMAKGQRLVGLRRDGRGKSQEAGAQTLLPTFLAVLDGRYSAAAVQRIRRNIEHVLSAKLSDALFFLEHDQRVGLEAYRQQLQGIIFLKGLGSMLQKSERIEQLALWLATENGSDGPERAQLTRAAFLCKTDLASSIVKEFPSLQGVMGGWYARHGGEPEPVSTAIREHYQPRHQGDRLPSARVGAIIAAADKIDAIVGCWWKGFAPTGSADPYGIRRAAQGVIAILWEHRLNCSLAELTGMARTIINAQQAKEGPVPESVVAAAQGYLAERLKAFFADRYPAELVEAVVSTKTACSVVGVGRRLEQLEQIWKSGQLAPAVKVAERTGNIVRGSKGADGLGDVDAARFEHPTEQRLWDVVRREHEPIQQLIVDGRYGEAVALYGHVFAESVHQFFYDVMVNVEDAAVRRNRLTMMQMIYRLLADEVADLSVLAPRMAEQEKERVIHG